MTEREEFLKAIRAKRTDNLPRLVYADWLDEHAESEALFRFSLLFRNSAGCSGIQIADTIAASDTPLSLAVGIVRTGTSAFSSRRLRAEPMIYPRKLSCSLEQLLSFLHRPVALTVGAKHPILPTLSPRVPPVTCLASDDSREYAPSFRSASAPRRGQ